MSTEEELLREDIEWLKSGNANCGPRTRLVIDKVLAALEKAQADKAYATHLIREAMRSGVNGSDHYSANWASDTGGFMRMYLARIDAAKALTPSPSPASSGPR